MVFITQKSMKNKYGADIGALETAYINFFTKEDVLPHKSVFLPIPNHLSHLHKLIETFHPDLIILTGGNNINPQSFGSDEKIEDISPIRDKVEGYLLDFAFANNIPVIGICRGFHFINVHLGGKLTLNLPNHTPAKSHICQFNGEKYIVNSYHNHGIMPGDLSKELKPIAKTIDGRYIEAFTHISSKKTNDKCILGVQWHPERLNTDTAFFRLLINKFINVRFNNL